jgi:UDP-N-acetylglucosamine acyltransferase
MSLPSSLHATAIIAPGVEIGEGTRVGAYAVIGEGVRLGRDNIVGPHAVVEGDTQIGDGNHIFQFASVGAQPQDLKFSGGNSRLRIGDGNVFREHVTIHSGAARPLGVTTIGDGNLFMANAHVAHDCRIGNHTRFVNGAMIAGYGEVGDHAFLSGLVAVHQFTRIGAFAFIAAGAMVSQDVPPFCLAHGDRARLVSLNEVGLRRNGFIEADVLMLRKVFRMLFRHGGSKAERMAAVDHAYAGRRGVDLLLRFLSDTKRGLAAA